MVNIPFFKVSSDGEPAQQSGKGITKRQFVGYAGAVLLALGIFMPVYSLPLFGSFSYYAVGNNAGIAMLIFAIASAAIVAIRKYKLLYVTGFMSLLLLVFSFLTLDSTISCVTAGMRDSPIGSLFASAIQYQWGWIVLLIGSIVITYTGEMKGE